MKRLLLVLFPLLSFSFYSRSQVVDYLVPATDLINMTVQTGDMCFDPLEYKQTSVGNTWGFQWTSTNGNTPTSITVDWVSVSEEGLAIPTTLNGNADATVTMNPSSCGFVGQLFTMNPANYNPLGVNTVLLDYSASVITAQLYPVIGSYVHIEVNYGVTCTDPDIPTLTATSPICPGGSTTINIAGNLNDATGWVVYNDACNGTVDGGTAGTTYVVSPGTTTTYYVQGEGGCVTPPGCGSITITVDDSQAPIPDVGSLSDINAECTSTPTAPTATDDCAGTVTGTPDVTFPITTQGTTMVTWTYDDGNGNTSTQTQNVILNDVTAPIPSVGSLTDFNAECTATPPSPTANDNCAGGLVGTPDVTFPITSQGTTMVTWTYDDGNGNTSTQTQNIVVNDVTAPVPDNATLADINAECSASPSAPTATDNCVGTVTATPDVTFPITAQGTTLITWTYDDGNGNTSTQTQNVILNDVTNPAFSNCPTDINVLASTSVCSAVVTWTPPTETDNCGASTVTSSHTSGSTFPLGTTTVTYTATDGAGNTATCSFNVTVGSDLNPVIDMMTMVDCFGNSTGAVGVNVIGGTAPYSYDWNSGAYITEDISGVPAGVYDFTVTDANGCTAMLSATVTEPASALGATIDLVNDPSSCGSADGNIDVTTTGGTSPYAYDWNSGAYSTEDISGLAAGGYTLLITDNNGCTFSVDTTLSDPGSPSVSIASISDATCNGDVDGSIDIDVTGGTAPYTYDWDNDGTGDNDDTEDLGGIGAGSYTVIVQDASGCSASISGTVNEPAALDVSVTQNGFDLTATATGVSYQWIDCATMSPIAGATSVTYTATSNGDYAVIITDGPCSDTSSCYTVEGVGVGEEVLDYRIYPNPASDELNIQLPANYESAKVQLFDMSGKLIMRSTEVDSGVATMSIVDLERGAYVITIQLNEKLIQEKIIKE